MKTKRWMLMAATGVTALVSSMAFAAGSTTGSTVGTDTLGAKTTTNATVGADTSGTGGSTSGTNAGTSAARSGERTGRAWLVGRDCMASTVGNRPRGGGIELAGDRASIRAYVWAIGSPQCLHIAQFRAGIEGQPCSID